MAVSTASWRHITKKLERGEHEQDAEGAERCRQRAPNTFEWTASGLGASDQGKPRAEAVSADRTTGKARQSRPRSLPPAGPGRLESVARSAGPDRSARSTGGHAYSGAYTNPLRAHAGVAL